MKKALSTLVILMFFQLGFSQIAYQPFPLTSAEWLVDSTRNYGNEIIGNLFYTDGDTLINSYDYKKVYSSYLGNVYDYNIYEQIYKYKLDYSPGNYVFSYRNDIPQKKVYIIFKNESEEKLWYRFDYSEGDTLKTDAYANYLYVNLYNNDNILMAPNEGISKMIVDKIDSVMICDQPHKRFSFIQDNPFTIYLIEGMGFTTNFIGNDGAIDFFEPSVIMETNFKTNDNCTERSFKDILTSSSQELSNLDISIFPNPVTNNIFIQNASLLVNATYQIRKITGEIISSGNIDKPIDCQQLASGFYLLQINTETNSYTSTFIKK